jgi:hypothetical protein
MHGASVTSSGLLLGSALFCSVSAAQSVTVRGKVEEVGANRFVIDCTHTTLVGTAFDLSLFVGQEVLLTGTWDGSTAVPSVDVQTIVNSIGAFEIPSNPRIGGTLRHTGFGLTSGRHSSADMQRSREANLLLAFADLRAR